jgi:hypothetical protein
MSESSLAHIFVQFAAVTVGFARVDWLGGPELGGFLRDF